MWLACVDLSRSIRPLLITYFLTVIEGAYHETQCSLSLIDEPGEKRKEAEGMDKCV